MNGFKGILLAGVLIGAPALAQDFPHFDLKQFDADGDGKVSLEEITQKRKAEAEALDADKDGKLSYDELVAGGLRDVRPRIEARVKARIAAQDTDGDGLLSAAELAVPPKGVRMFNRLDADSDGVLTGDEIKAARDRKHQDRPHHGDRPGDRRAKPGDAAAQ
ncbi:EF-hand domain-containing protein [Paenirhodobacter sp.]|uniref:EF-hand domain-containing protein n=1 Tax=Paenirhodobacter sp. TaxID=1965326 RepID=UPI003B4042E0